MNGFCARSAVRGLSCQHPCPYRIGYRGIGIRPRLYRSFFADDKGRFPPHEIPYGALAFWVTWILVFSLIDRIFVKKPSSPTVPPEIKTQNRIYLAAVLVLGFIDLGISVLVMQKWNSGSDEGILPLIGLSLFIGIISMIVIVRYFIFIMDNREKARKTAAAEVLVQPNPLPAIKTKDPVIVPDNPSIFQIFSGFVRYPEPMMEKVKEKTLFSAFLYFLIMAGGAFAILIGIALLFSGRLLPDLLLPVLRLFLPILLALFYGGIITFFLIRLQGVRISFLPTLHTLFYASTPIGLIGWIPLFGFLHPFSGCIMSGSE